MTMLTGKWSLPCKSWSIETIVKIRMSRDAIDRSIVDLACPEEEIKVGDHRS